MAAARAAIDRDGVGTTGSRAANGTYAAHRRLEDAFADIYGKRHALVFTTGYQANLGVISGLCGPEDTVLLDIESHASIYDGAKLSGAQVFAFRHNSAADLARKLARQPNGRRCLVVVEGLYSISGDVAPLAEIAAACRAAGAWLMVDEAHSFGAFGARGLGCAEAQGVLDEVDFVVGTFSKALAGVGGYCVSNHPGAEAAPFRRAPLRLHGIRIAREYRRSRGRPEDPAAPTSRCAAACGKTSGGHARGWRGWDSRRAPPSRRS